MENNFELFLAQIKLPLKSMVKRLNGHHQELDDDDLFQEACIHLWQRLAKNELSDKNKSYILKSCYFHLKNYLRNKNFSYRLSSLDCPIDENGTMLKDMISKEDDGNSCGLESAMLIEDIKRCCLTAREKDVLKFYLKGHTTREIGDRLHISHVRVVKLMSQIKDKYKNLRYQDE